jgi:hypothetical protein
LFFFRVSFLRGFSLFLLVVSSSALLFSFSPLLSTTYRNSSWADVFPALVVSVVASFCLMY